MARARNIKPGFAKNEDLAECSMAARLCFALLPMLADREGRLEDRPKRIKGELFAFDSIEVEPLLAELAQRGFIERYVVDGRALIQILAFHKHQNPHHREPDSTLPPHPSLRLDADGKWVKPEADPCSQPPGAQEKPRLDPPRSDLQGGSNRVDSGFSDSGALIPEEPLTVVGAATAVAKAPAPPRGTRLPEGWALPKAWGEWALLEYPHWTPEKVRREAANFADHWHGASGKGATKVDWLATWRKWCRDPLAHRDDPKQAGAQPKSFAERDAAAKLARFNEATRNAFAQQPKAETIDMEASDGAPRLLA